MSLVARFLETSIAQGDVEAIVSKNRRHTYRELRSLTLQVAGYLIDNGLMPGDRVALIHSNSFEYIAIFYGIWAAGGVTVALNTQAKSLDLKNWLDHAAARFLFAESGNSEIDEVCNLSHQTVHSVRTQRHNTQIDRSQDERWMSIVNGAEATTQLLPADSDTASIIYTSGTTGSPKGVTLSHRNLEANTNAILEYLSLTAEDSIVNVLPFYYSYGNSVLHTHLAAGGRLVLENSLFFPHNIMRQIEIERTSGFSGVPATFSLLLNRVKFADYDLSNLRYITQAGGPMAQSIIDKLTQALPNCNIYIMYGQTEASARLSYLPPCDLNTKRGSIGFAIPGVTLELRDSKGHPVLPGQTGEIFARGPNIMQGYWRDPKATNKILQEGWLHTGDLAHMDNEGYLYIDGRSSDMIKSGGNRINPVEIEEVIQQLDGVKEVAIIGIPDDLLGEAILALVVPVALSALDKMSVQHHCKKHLALYKIPKIVEFIETIPRTASGKIQRFRLLQKYQTASLREQIRTKRPS